MSTGQWYHVAYVRESGTLKIYFNGTVDSTTQSYSSQFGKTGTLYFGDQHAGGGGAPQYYIDDLRITKGLARYTSNFTAPTTAHLTSAGDSLKNIIVNSDADGVIVGTGGINPVRLAKSWVNFTGSGTPSINASYNVSSITDTDTGRYTVNFSTALTDANYCFAGSAGNNGATTNGRDVSLDGTRTTSGVAIRVSYNDSSTQDDAYIGVMVFGN